MAVCKFSGNLVYMYSPHFGKLYKEKSGNPVPHPTNAFSSVLLLAVDLVLNMYVGLRKGTQSS
jgi:hypothetical protein